MLQVTHAELDTDNLKLDDLGDAQGTEIGLELEAIMLTGSCIDTAFESSESLHPRGTQLVLQNSQSQPLQDTLVMSNLGYFQLKTVPGNLCCGFFLAAHVLSKMFTTPQLDVIWGSLSIERSRIQNFIKFVISRCLAADAWSLETSFSSPKYQCAVQSGCAKA